MDTRGQTGVNEQQPSHYVVEEEFTIEVPLVRPKAPFLEVLKLAGARSEVFTKKEICHYLKEYISSRKLFDLEDPRVVHCKGDLLGGVFDLDSFTIEDVIKLIELHCYQVPDTCHKKKRHLVTKPFPNSISRHNEPGSVRIAVCRALPQTVSPVITSTSTLRPPSRKSSSSSCETRKSRNQSRSLPRNQSAVEISVTSNYGNKPANQNKASSQKAESTDGEKSQEEMNNNNKRKKKSVDSSSSGSGRKRHHTEPLAEPSTSGSSSRRRGTSFSISVSDTDGDKDRFPWYFEVEMSGNHNREDGSSEVLSIQGRETASIHDSTDDLWFLEEDNYVEVDTDTEFSVEFDVESDCASVFESDISSVRSGEGGFLVVCKESDVEFFADCSDSDSNCGDKELTEADNWACTECKLSNPPYQRYCDRCWKMRADWLPTRHSSLSNDDLDPKSRSKQDTADKCDEKYEDFTLKGAERMSSIDSGFTSFSSPQPSSQETVVADISVLKNVSIPLATINTEMLLNESKEDEVRYSLANFQSKALDSLSHKEVKGEKEVTVKDDSAAEKCDGQATKPQATALDDPCMICLSKPKTASLIHGSSGHQICCFTCAKRLKRTGQVCPICRRPIQKVILNHIL